MVPLQMCFILSWSVRDTALASFVASMHIDLH